MPCEFGGRAASMIQYYRALIRLSKAVVVDGLTCAPCARLEYRELHHAGERLRRGVLTLWQSVELLPV